ncbi:MULTISPECIES: class III lanthionine synthetase LanKC [unclassified Streptomyces]|uniref:class III lanthionine synthetase LanKC n=1 Tax=unclassified Streptomyces TaxID=2593676 RepID=UPI00336AD3F3
MDRSYEAFCITDPDFYDRIDVDVADEHLFPVLRKGAVPAGWRRIAAPGWVTLHPPGVRLPVQGWKVHVSAAMEHADAVTEKVWTYCVEHITTFKLVPSRREYRNRNSKYGERAGSGKLATIYAVDERHLLAILTGLGEALHGVPGPYILSDLRWGSGPLYVRYGAFRPRTLVTADGRETMAIETPDGTLVPDPRGPVFTVPDWVRIPDFLQPEVARRNATRVDDLPCDIVRALHFSNGGGVYEGRDKDSGARVVVKEARPYAGLDGAGRDAVSRLRRERDVLERLRGLPGVPELKGYFTAADHEFLIEEFVEGESLYSECGQRNPLIAPGPAGAEELREYRRWAMTVWQQVADLVRAMHARGVVFGDLHQFNVLPAPSGERVSLIDFEASWFIGENGRQTLANPGFMAPRGFTGPDVDEFALAALKIAIFAPLTPLIWLDGGKAAHLAALVAERFGVPEEWLADAVAVLQKAADAPGKAKQTPGEAGEPPERAAVSRPVGAVTAAWPACRSSMVTAIRDSATTARTDRLFPGDIAQFLEPGAALGMAHGAAGVLWALHTAGAERFPEGEKWLLEQALRDRSDDPPGFYNGLHGIAYALWDLGRCDAAVQILENVPRDDAKLPDSSLFKGLSGVGLNWLHFARVCGEDRYLRRALHAADTVRERLGKVTDVPEVSGGGNGIAGLMLGSSGPALLLTAVFEETGDPGYLDAAATALRQDLRRCVLDDKGTLQMNEGWRATPYLASGSVGVGMVLDRYLRCRPDPELAGRLAQIRSAATSSFYLFPGLFHGAGGMVLFNANHAPGPQNFGDRLPTVLDWHVLDWRGHLGFPGSQLLRLSMDLATGSAGVLLALTAADRAGGGREQRVSLPFLLPSELPAARTRSAGRGSETEVKEGGE